MQLHKLLTHTLRRSTALLLVLVLLAACALPFDAERRYLSLILTHAQSTISLIQELQTQLANPRIGEQTWESQVNGNIAALRIQTSEARQIDPPPRFAEFHRSYLGVMDSLDGFIDTLNQAMALRDNRRVRDTLQQLDQASQQIDQIYGQIQQQVETQQSGASGGY